MNREAEYTVQKAEPRDSRSARVLPKCIILKQGCYLSVLVLCASTYPFQKLSRVYHSCEKK
jgi:hypothetical protein